MKESTNDLTVLEIKRNIILNTMLRYTPGMQPIKDEAIDKFEENVLYSNGLNDWQNEKQIQENFSSGSGGCYFNGSDLYKSLMRLSENKRISFNNQNEIKHYRLSKEVFEETKLQRTSFDNLLKYIVDNLFEHAIAGSDKYLEPFSLFLANVFSMLGEETVRLILGKLDKSVFLSHSTFNKIISAIKNDFSELDYNHFSSSVKRFFEEEDPKFNELKLIMSQNYYLAKAIGLDPTGNLLSEEMFRGSTFYLDTNIALGVMDVESAYHLGIIEMGKACKKIDINLKIAKITIDEIKNWAAVQEELFTSALDQIPEGLKSKVRSSFLKVYDAKIEKGEDVEIKDLFISFNDPIEELNKYFDVDLVDDLWFDRAEKEQITKDFALELKEKYNNNNQRNKSEAASIHDALILRWIDKQNSRDNEKILMLTADRSLPGMFPPGSTKRNLAITRESLFQWLYTLSTPSKDKESFTKIFSKMLENRVLPQARILKLADFKVFDLLEMKCKNLPEKDVEDCIRYYKSEGPSLNPLDPIDLQKMQRSVSQFFTSDDLVYRQEMDKLNNLRKSEKIDYDKSLGRVKEHHRKIYENKDLLIDSQTNEIDQLKTDAMDRQSKRESKRRSVIALLLFIILNSISSFFAANNGTTDNWLQNIEQFPLIMNLTFWGSLTVGVGIIGPERIKHSWGFIRQLFGQAKP